MTESLETCFANSVFQGTLRALRDGQLEVNDVLSILQPFENDNGVLTAHVNRCDREWLETSCRMLEEASSHLEHRERPITIDLRERFDAQENRRVVLPLVMHHVPDENDSEDEPVQEDRDQRWSQMTRQFPSRGRQLHPQSYVAFRRLQTQPSTSFEEFARAVRSSQHPSRSFRHDDATNNNRVLRRSRLHRHSSFTPYVMRLGPKGWNPIEADEHLQQPNEPTAFDENQAVVVDGSLHSWSQRDRLPSDRVPSDFLCPITHETMRDPVTASDGYSYEREAIERWLSDHDTSPMTNAVMLNTNLVSNHVLRRIIDQHEMQSRQPLALEAQLAVS